MNAKYARRIIDKYGMVPEQESYAGFIGLHTKGEFAGEPVYFYKGTALYKAILEMIKAGEVPAPQPLSKLADYHFR